jgi:hypothetical protein
VQRLLAGTKNPFFASINLTSKNPKRKPPSSNHDFNIFRFAFTSRKSTVLKFRHRIAISLFSQNQSAKDENHKREAKGSSKPSRMRIGSMDAV